MAARSANPRTLRHWLREALASDDLEAHADDRLRQGEARFALLALAIGASQDTENRSFLERTALLALRELGDIDWENRDHKRAQRVYRALCALDPSASSSEHARLASSTSHVTRSVQGWLERLRQIGDTQLSEAEEALFTRDVLDLLQRSAESMRASLRDLLSDPDPVIRACGITVLRRAATPEALAVIADRIPQLVSEIGTWPPEDLREVLRASASLGRWTDLQQRIGELEVALRAPAIDSPGRDYLRRLGQPVQASMLPTPVPQQGMFNGPPVLQRLREWERHARIDRNDAAVEAQRSPFSLWLRAAAGEIPPSSAAPGWPVSQALSYLVQRKEIDGRELLDCYDGLLGELQFSWQHGERHFHVPASSPLAASGLAERQVRVAVTVANHPQPPADPLQPRRAGVALRMSNLSHHLIHELTFLDKAVKVGVQDAVSTLYVAADPIVAVEELFPEFAGRVVRLPDADLPQRAEADRVSLLPATDFFVSRELGRRLLLACSTSAEPEHAEACSNLRAHCETVLMLSVGEHALRQVDDWRATMQALLLRLRERQPTLGCIVVGATLARDAAVVSTSGIRQQRALADSLFSDALAGMPHHLLVGSRVASAIHGAGLCNAYLTEPGRPQALASLVAGKPGVVYAPVEPPSHNPMFRCVTQALHPSIVTGEPLTGGRYRLDPAALDRALTGLIEKASS